MKMAKLQGWATKLLLFCLHCYSYYVSVSLYTSKSLLILLLVLCSEAILFYFPFLYSVLLSALVIFQHLFLLLLLLWFVWFFFLNVFSIPGFSVFCLAFCPLYTLMLLLNHGFSMCTAFCLRPASHSDQEAFPDWTLLSVISLTPSWGVNNISRTSVRSTPCVQDLFSLKYFTLSFKIW